MGVIYNKFHIAGRIKLTKYSGMDQQKYGTEGDCTENQSRWTVSLAEPEEREYVAYIRSGQRKQRVAGDLEQFPKNSNR